MSDLDNPYFEEVAGGVTVGADRASWGDRDLDALRRREDLVQEYAWAIPNEAAIETIAEHSPIVEVGAGAGYWAHLLDQAGAVVAATDVDPPEDTWRHVAEYDARRRANAMVGEEQGHALLLVWPPGGDPMAADAIRAHPGDTVIYVGEGRGGCTADDELHQLLHEEWELEETVAIPTYLAIRDRLEVWQR